MARRKTIAIDFDGVIHSYESDWVSPQYIPDAPVPGAIEWLAAVIQQYDVVIYSARANSLWGRWAMWRWLKKEAGMLWDDSPGFRGLSDLSIKAKPHAMVYVDDRGFRFEGRFPSVESLVQMKPWNQVPR